MLQLSIESTGGSCGCTNRKMFMCFRFVLGSQLFFAFELIKYDFQKDEPMRNEQGWCHRVREGKTGCEDALLIKEPESTRNWC